MDAQSRWTGDTFSTTVGPNVTERTTTFAHECTNRLRSSQFFRLRIPWICEEYEEGSTSFHALVCSPFWGYGTMRLMLVFFFLFCLRLYARKKVRTWLVGRGIEDEVHSPLATEGSGGVYQRLLGNRPHVFLMKSTLSCFTTFVTRILLQVLQWWIIMISVLVIFLAIEMLDAQRRYQLIGKDWHVQHPPIFRDIPRGLVMFSIYSFGAVIFSYCVSFVCILLQFLTHVTEAILGPPLRCSLCQAGAGIISLPRDVSIQVILLPMVYAFLSVKSVACMWSIMTRNFEPAMDCPRWDSKQKIMVLRTVEDKIKLQKLVYSSNFALADMYEAWALFCFGSMVAKVMQPELRKKIKMDVVKAFEKLLLIDVSMFVLVCAVGAAYQIMLTWFQWRLGIDICESSPAICSLTPYLTGANWCVSSIAIYNLFTIETKFHHLTIMEKFKPRLKFWSIKLMVLVAFWQSFLMAFIRDGWNLTEDEGELLDASFRCYVMAIVSLLNVKAWYPWAKWYHHVLISTDDKLKRERGRGDESGVLREIGVKHVPQGTILLVQKLFPRLRTEKDAEDWPTVEEAINGLEDDQVNSALWRGSQHGWVVATDLDSQKRGKKRQALCDLSVQERRKALKDHLMSFFPEV